MEDISKMSCVDCSVGNCNFMDKSFPQFCPTVNTIDEEKRDEIKNIYVAKQFCDMRKQIDGLALIVTSQFSMNVLDHSLFIFTDFSPSYIWLRRIIMSV